MQFFPFSQASLLRTTPLSGVATGDGCEYRQSAFVHLIPNLQSVGIVAFQAQQSQVVEESQRKERELAQRKQASAEGLR